MEHTMRITTAGSVSSYASFALTFLIDNPDRPLVLHTRPDPAAAASSSSSSALHQATLAAPRLISVVEKVKRGHPARLWQYTTSGLLEPVVEERPSLARVLGGKTKPKLTHRPYLEITLSTRPLGLETKRNVACQRAGTSTGTGMVVKNPRTSEKKDQEDQADQGSKSGDGDKGDDVPRADVRLAASTAATEGRAKRKSEAADVASKRIRT